MSEPSYEMSAEEEKSFALLGNGLRVFIAILFLSGVMAFLSGMFVLVDEGLTFTLFYQVVVGFALIMVSSAFYYPLDNFRNIIKTEGRDIEELTQGFIDLKNGLLVVLVFLGLYIIKAFVDFVTLLGSPPV